MCLIKSWLLIECWFSSHDVIFRHCSYRYFVTMVCALSRIAQMTHFYVTRWGDGGGGQTILEYVLSRLTFFYETMFLTLSYYRVMIQFVDEGEVSHK